MQLISNKSTPPFRDSQWSSLSLHSRQLPPLHNTTKQDFGQQAHKFEEDWDISSHYFIHYAGGSSESTPLAVSPTQTSAIYLPCSNQPFEGLNFREHCNSSRSPDVEMLSSATGWASSSQYSSGASSYPSSTSSTQSYYSSRPALVTPSRNQQNLPSLTEMNLNNTPGYTTRSTHTQSYPRHQNLLASASSTTPYFSATNDRLDIPYAGSKATLASPYATTYNSFSPRSSYAHNPQYTSTLESYSPTIDPYAYSNGHSWPPSLSYPSSYPNMSDTSSIGSGRRRRGNLPKHVTDILRAWFHEHLDHPYPTDEDKQMLIGRTNLSISQISNWFINARRRHWPQLKAERERTLQVQGTGYKGTLGKP